MTAARPVRRRLRRRLTLASFLLSALVVAGAVAALTGALHAEAQAAIRARLDDRAAALAATVDLTGGTVDIRGADDALLDSPNWVFDAVGRRVEGATLRGSTGAVIAALGRSTSARRTTAGTLHLLAVPVRRHGRVAAVVVTGVDEAPYTATLASTSRAAILLGALAVLGATGLAALVLSRSLGPMAVMTERAAGWS
ncbi:hypothetical protein, partial [uncultured Amnibacterium sp.]|uniref:hypothetical protein n=1 Tax=uncultured Amnibacterium sp. TaxID=1631851 RepID=UPI0035CC7589